MPPVDWSRVVDVERAAANVRTEFPGDWYVDPWGWPELGYLSKYDVASVLDHCRSADTGRGIAIDVPKENWGSRPAVVLDVLDRLVYQATVDTVSVKLIGDMAREAYGWRLPPNDPKRGMYSHNNHQWEGYRGHLTWLAASRPVALLTDIVSFFASIPLSHMHDSLDDSAPSSVATKRIHTLLDGFAKIPSRSGLPQRSLASSVLANMYLRPFDDALRHLAPTIPKFLSIPEVRGFARWMDDSWLFADDAGSARKAQVELQDVVRSLGLNLNSAKTVLLQGDDVLETALQIQHSAIDDALDSKDVGPLEELIGQLLDEPAKASRTSLRFASTRLRKQKHLYKSNELLAAALEMPHGADALAPIFQLAFTPSSLQDWLLSYAGSDYSAFEWSTAQYLRMFPSSRKPKRAVIDFVSERIYDSGTQLPMLATAAQRLAAWDRDEARAVISDAMRKVAHPQAKRVLSLAGATAGVERRALRRWLGADPETAVTLRMLEHFSFKPPRVTRDAFDSPAA
jgi:hypothetical protein